MYAFDKNWNISFFIASSLSFWHKYEFTEKMIQKPKPWAPSHIYFIQNVSLLLWYCENPTYIKHEQSIKVSNDSNYTNLATTFMYLNIFKLYDYILEGW